MPSVFSPSCPPPAPLAVHHTCLWMSGTLTGCTRGHVSVSGIFCTHLRDSPRVQIPIAHEHARSAVTIGPCLVARKRHASTRRASTQVRIILLGRAGVLERLTDGTDKPGSRVHDTRAPRPAASTRASRRLQPSCGPLGQKRGRGEANEGDVETIVLEDCVGAGKSRGNVSSSGWLVRQPRATLVSGGSVLRRC